jgi:hypothetical protein
MILKSPINFIFLQVEDFFKKSIEVHSQKRKKEKNKGKKKENGQNPKKQRNLATKWGRK